MEKYTAVSVAKRKQGWQARLRYKENGKWKETSKMLPEAKGKKEAEKLAEELRQRLNKVAEKDAAPANERTVDEVVRSYLDYQLSIGELERSTYDRQYNSYEKNIEPILGNYGFDSLDRTAIIDWHTKLSQKGLSQHTIYANKIIINKVYNYYVEIGELDRNPFDSVKGLQHAVVKRITHLTPEQMEHFLDCVFQEFEPKDPMYPAILLCFYGALRRSEALALRWRNINWDANTITIDSAIGGSKYGNYTKGVKNKSSRRTFPIIPQLAKCLKLRYEAVKPVEDNWYVCGYKTMFITLSQFNYRFRMFVRRYDLRDAYGNYVTSHALRHNAASVGVRSGMDISALSLMMGHASRAMTLDTYADASEESKRVGAERLSIMFSKDTDDEIYYPEEEPKEAK